LHWHRARSDYGAATMPSQLKTIQSHLDDASAKGAKFAVGGIDSVHAAFVDPVIMLNVPEDSIAMQEETFGPTLAINRVKDIETAIELANSTRYGLSASVWSGKNGNISFAAIASVPFGGIKDSGMGRIHGPEGLLEFTYPRTVISPRFDIPIEFTTFKRSKFVDKFIKTLIKFLHSKITG
jgi:acyl-CoA reductase-like NAD-dependent aldehyde dehydrogenase